MAQTVVPLRWLESDRLAALRGYEVLDTPPEPEFDDLARLAARACLAPVALVSLIDEHRQWFKARYNHAVCETARSESICAHAITGTDVFIVPDLRDDPRFSHFVRQGDATPILSYAGAPLINADGLPLGTVCVVDFVPRRFDARQQESLRTIARQVIAQLELRKARIDRARSEAQLQLALTASTVVGSWEWDAEEGVLRGDPRFAALHGEPPVRYDAACRIADHLFAVHPLDRPTVAASLSPAFSRGTDFSVEYRSQSGERWLSMEGRRQPDRPTRYAGILVDITARKEIELARHDEATTIDALYRISEAFGKLGQGEPPLDLIADIARELTGAEAAAVCLRGETHGDFGVRSLTRRIPRIAATAPLALPTDCIEPRLARYAGDRDATEFYPFETDEAGSLLSTPILSEDGAMIGVLRLAHASTDAFDTRAERLAEGIARQAAAGLDRRELQRRLARSEETLRVAVDSSNLGLWDYDIAGDTFRCSPKCLSLLGLIGDEHLSLGAFLRSCRIEDRAASEEVMLAALDPDSGGGLDLAFRVADEDGALRWVQARGRIFFSGGIPRRASGTLEDVTARKQDEETIREARRLAEDASLAKNEFLATMSHEIRTPVGAVIGLAEILSRSEPLSERQRVYLASLNRSADQLMTLVSDLLDLSKIESREVVLESIAFEPARIVEDVAQMLGVSAREKGLMLLTDTGGLSGARYLGDPTRLRQIVLNLCSNAIKFTGKGGIGLRLDTGGPNGERVEIAVRDSGIGIPADRQEAIFGRYRQAETSTTREYGGTGLGLSIARSLAELMGGDIRLDSRPGQGSTFTVSLPLAAAPPEADRAAAPVAEPLTEKRILLVEDHPASALVTAELLAADRHRYDLAETGPAALQLIEREPYDLVLMDVQLAGIDGIETTRRIRQREAALGLPAVPIIGITAHVLRGDRERCLEAGMDDYLAKPFAQTLLREKILLRLAPAGTA